MSVQTRIAKLEGLLGRIQKNARAPRTAAATLGSAPAPVSAVIEAAPVAAPAPPSPPLAAAPAPPPSSRPTAERPSRPAGSSPYAVPLGVVPLTTVTVPARQPIVEVPYTPPAAVRDEVDELLGEEPESLLVAEDELVIEEPAPEEPVHEQSTASDDVSFDEAEEATAPASERPAFGGFELVEEAPASSRRPRIAASMDEALAGAAAHMEPPMTPPPESGPAPSAGVSELAIPQAPARPASIFPAVEYPTTEQLGQTVTLEEGPSADLELDEPLSETGDDGLDLSAPQEGAHLEAELPAAGAGMYDLGLASPPEAREELERVRLGQVQADVVARPLISTNVVDFVSAGAQTRPGSFLELIDGSLSVG